MPQPDQPAQDLQPARDLQRAFAGHVRTLRGSLPNANDTGAPNVQQFNLDGHDNGTVEAGREVQVREEVNVPPVAAFVDTLPMPIRIVTNIKPQGELNTYTVFLKVPAGIQLGAGHVRLEWPIRTIPAVPPLRLISPSAYRTFNLLVNKGAIGTKVQVGKFDARPIEVEFGDQSVPEDQFGYKDGVLEATVPTDIGKVMIRVTTADGKRYRSDSVFLTYRSFDLLTTEGVVGTEVTIGRFDYPPIKVVFFDPNAPKAEPLLLPKDAFRFNENILHLTIPGPPDEPDAKGSKVAVETANHHQLHISNKFFRRQPAPIN